MSTWCLGNSSTLAMGHSILYSEACTWYKFLTAWQPQCPRTTTTKTIFISSEGNLDIVWSMQVYMQRQSGNFLVFRTTLTQESKTDKMCACISIYISCSHHAYRFMTTSVTSITQKLNNFQFQEWILTSSSPFLFISSGQHYSWT